MANCAADGFAAIAWGHGNPCRNVSPAAGACRFNLEISCCPHGRLTHVRQVKSHPHWLRIAHHFREPADEMGVCLEKLVSKDRPKTFRLCVVAELRPLKV